MKKKLTSIIKKLYPRAANVFVWLDVDMSKICSIVDSGGTKDQNRG